MKEVARAFARSLATIRAVMARLSASGGEVMHVVLAMSPIGDSFRVRCRMFPSLINCCTIDWYDRWPPEALYSVSKQFLAVVEFSEEPEREFGLRWRRRRGLLRL